MGTSEIWRSTWSRASFGSDLCLDSRYSHTAQQYLKELGHPERIPGEAQRPESQAIAEMANWLAHPQEFGRAPDSIELFDTRELFWPPTNDRRRLSLVKYSFHGGAGREADSGIGMVGSVTFALFGEVTADLSPEDIYGLHCCWELEIKGDSRAPKKRTAQAGREILGRHNEGF